MGAAAKQTSKQKKTQTDATGCLARTTPRGGKNVQKEITIDNSFPRCSVNPDSPIDAAGGARSEGAIRARHRPRAPGTTPRSTHETPLLHQYMPQSTIR